MDRLREDGLLDWCVERGCRGRALRHGHGHGRGSVRDGGCGRGSENEMTQLRFLRPFRVS